MKIGICTSDPKQILLAYELGYDFVEVNNKGDVMNDEKYPELLALSKKLPEGFFYSCNCLLAPSPRITGPDADFDGLREYCEKSFARLAELGVRMIVFGSSDAKRIPEGFSREVATEQIINAVRMFSDIAEKYGQRVCIEPLREAECNCVNTVDEAVEIATLADRANVGAHADYYHMMQNGEKLSKLTTLAKHIMHTHIASPCKRNAPSADDGADYKYFFDALRRGGYDATVSFEGSFKPTREDMREMRDYLASL